MMRPAGGTEGDVTKERGGTAERKAPVGAAGGSESRPSEAAEPSAAQRRAAARRAHQRRRKAQSRARDAGRDGESAA